MKRKGLIVIVPGSVLNSPLSLAEAVIRSAQDPDTIAMQVHVNHLADGTHMATVTGKVTVRDLMNSAKK